jgi:hypothetical protein
MSTRYSSLPLWGRVRVGAAHWNAPIPTYLAGRAGPVAQLLARHKQSTGLFVSGLGPQRGKELLLEASHEQRRADASR